MARPFTSMIQTKHGQAYGVGDADDLLNDRPQRFGYLQLAQIGHCNLTLSARRWRSSWQRSAPPSAQYPAPPISP
jgi:hypothetical protein